MCDTNTLQGDCQLPSGEQSSGVTVATRMGVIYRITNKLNGKIYVGKTKRLVEVRFKEHFNEKTYIGRVMRKHGVENFTVEVIEVCPVESLNEKERYWIAKLNSKAPNGYNLTDGGDGLTGCTQRTRAKMSETQKAIGSRPPSFKGKHHSVKTRAKFSIAGKGKKHSSEHNAKISAALKAYWARKKLESQNKS